MMKNKEPLVIVAGPTASGKSAAAVELASRLKGSVISADSIQVYRGMDIGSAKVTREETAGIPHYLIDILEPDEDWNVVSFQAKAREAIAEIRSRGRLPILCGGTGFYIQSVLYDIDFTEVDDDRAYRQELEDLARTKGPEALHALLEAADPASAEAIHPNNIKRTIRALEFARQSGGRISDHNRAQREREAAYKAAFFVLTMDRARLYERIDRRVDLMMDQGLVEEVRGLMDRGLTASHVSMQGLGYKQVCRALSGEMSLEEAVYEIKRDTRHFAKRQLTWFKRERDVIWTDAGRFENTAAMADWMESVIRERGLLEPAE